MQPSYDYRYTWKALYSDGTSLLQKNPDGTTNPYAAIDRTRLASFELWDAGTRVFAIPFTPGQRLIWRRRVAMSAGNASDVCHIVGKQETVDGQNRQVIFALFESDGHTEVSDHYDEAHPWFFPVQIHPQEGEEEG